MSTILQKLANFTQRCVNILLPSCCYLCGTPTCHSLNLCSLCLSVMPWLKHCCSYCANPMPAMDNDGIRICGQCLKQPPLFEKTSCLFLYEKPASILITQLKFQHRLLLANSLGNLLKNKLNPMLQNNQPDLLIPVPLHPMRLRQRGFNQALEIARPVSHFYNIPIDKTSLIRTRSTLAQSEIPAKQRYSNVKNAFQCNRKLKNLHVLLIDDVITTGNTIHECCKALKNAEALKIDVCAVARTAFSN